MNKRHRNIVFITLQVLLLAGIVLVLFQKSTQLNQLHQFNWEVLKNPQSLLGVALALLLVIGNYSIETLKWKVLLARPNFSYVHHYKALLAGSAISLFLPFRSGEYLGRILYFPRAIWSSVILSSIRSGMYQLLVTLSIGLLCLLFVNVDQLLHLNKTQLVLISLVLILGVVYVVLHLERILKWALHQTKIKLSIHKGQLYWRKGLWLSALRYLIFILQYFLLFWAFEIESLHLVWLWIPIYLLVQTVVPTIFITEMGLRAALCLLIFYEPMAMVPIFVIYIINIILPATVGAFMLRLHKK